MHFRHRKHHRHGLGLGDGDQTVGVSRAHQTAQLGLFQTKASADGCSHPCVGQLQFGGLNLRMIGLHRALQLRHQRRLRFHLLACDGVFFQQILVALQIQLGIQELRVIACELTQRLIELRFESTRINLCQ